MSDFDLSASLAAARKAAETAARSYVDAQAVLADAADELTRAKAQLDRIERALAILNGEEPVSAAKASAQSMAVAEPAPSPKPRKSEPVGPYATMKCGGCQETGTMYETLRPTKNNTMVRLLVCNECSNEVYLG